MAETDIDMALSGEDIVKLQTATFLTLCSALSGAGVIRLADLAGILSAHTAADDQGAWAQVVRALAAVLAQGPASSPDRPVRRPFTLVAGGLDAPPPAG